MKEAAGAHDQLWRLNPFFFGVWRCANAELGEEAGRAEGVGSVEVLGINGEGGGEVPEIAADGR
ncbi:MAG TPA: hypothetical protein VMO17_18225 [Terriglobia bacterium]|nr:hypothetical protein [Terriglobia bacterium]